MPEVGIVIPVRKRSQKAMLAFRCEPRSASSRRR